jgi:hypothetical protein
MTAPPDVRQMVGHLADRWGCHRLIELNGAGAEPEQRYGADTAGLCLLQGAAAERGTVPALTQLVRQATVTVVAFPTGGPSDPANAADRATRRLDELCTALGRQPAFTGWTRSDPSGRRTTAVAIFEGEHVPPLTPPPSEFRVLAVMTAFNEGDIIAPIVRRLLAQGVEVHLLDNWSTDGTEELLRRDLPDPRLTVERFPRTDTRTYEWERLLTRVEDIAAASTADWVMHHDADEIRQPPWPDLDLRAAFHAVQVRGFNAVDHTVLDFRPTDDAFVEGDDPGTYFTHCEFGRRPGHFVQIKAWQNRERVRLAESGGHEAVFERRRVFPYKFLLRHYPMRSQRHTERKIFFDRHPRFSPIERERGWHFQYDTAEPGQSFLHDPSSLLTFDERFPRLYIPEVMTGAGIPRL